ncbi:DUF1294 domain-containing protein [Neisseria weaveri]|uniref:DUF1294 domain-containing protein n=1 Tax=Neisseria weaveri TaxID=28091 RepID=UPI00031F9321|nr:DUF1294 domain-containing protein [Neisseria weaveri]
MKSCDFPFAGHQPHFRLAQNSHEHIEAAATSRLPMFREGVSVKVRLSEWDLQLNGGFGVHEADRSEPVFVLGQFLNDQTRVPEAGEWLKGRLTRHDNGQWMMVDVENVSYQEVQQTIQRLEKERALRQQQKQEEQAKPAVVKEPVKIRHPFPGNTVLHGKIIRWDDKKSCGFIQSGPESEVVFFHISAFHYQGRRPEVGQQVSFYCDWPMTEGQLQRVTRVMLREHEMELFNDKPYQHTQIHRNTVQIMLHIAVGLIYLALVASISFKLAAFYLLASIVALLVYGYDKGLAERNARNTDRYTQRIPESYLHNFAFIGGWPGALTAQIIFHHKLRKAAFMRKFWVTVVANIAITYILLIHYADSPLVLFLKN